MAVGDYDPNLNGWGDKMNVALGMRPGPVDSRVAAGFAAVQNLLADAKAELRAGSLVGAMEQVVHAEQVLNRALSDLETVSDAPYTAVIYTMRGGKA